MRRRAYLALALLSIASPLGSTVLEAQGPTTIFVVRHAEKGPEPDDPGLTEKGGRRAVELARALQDARVSALFATQYKRTQQTLAPLASALGTTLVLMDASDMNGLIAKLQALPPGSRAAVASHSNLVHVIVERLSGIKVAQLTDADYDRMFVVTFGAGGTGVGGSVVILRFGEP